MDDYTRRTRDWLDAIYEGAPGVGYVPHAPVHGFKPLSRYIGTYCHLFAVLGEISRYEFSNCLEVGAGEGFLCSLIERIFAAQVTGVDLSRRVCRRAAEYFGVRSTVAEALHLPFRDRSFDLVVSINTLEHIIDVPAAFAEMRRVARGVVVIGMPHASNVGEQEPAEEPHAHVSLLTRREMRSVFGENASIRGSLSRFARPLYALAASDDVSMRPRHEFLRRAWAQPFYAAARAVASRLDARHTVAWLCHLEEWLSRLAPRLTRESIIVCEKEPLRSRRPRISSAAILEALLC